jgi:hypothetical protein
MPKLLRNILSWGVIFPLVTIDKPLSIRSNVFYFYSSSSSAYKSPFTILSLNNFNASTDYLRRFVIPLLPSFSFHESSSCYQNDLSNSSLPPNKVLLNYLVKSSAENLLLGLSLSGSSQIGCLENTYPT